MKKLISVWLISAMTMCNLPVCAWAPTDFNNHNCIDLRDLGTITDNVTKKNVCRCKTCVVCALMYNKLEDYLIELENQFNNILKKENYLENKVKLDNIELVLDSISRAIDRKDYKNSNFLLISTNYDPNDSAAIAFFSKIDNITYKNDYNDAYFLDINNKLKKILKRVHHYVKLREDSPVK